MHFFIRRIVRYGAHVAVCSLEWCDFENVWGLNKSFSESKYDRFNKTGEVEWTYGRAIP